MTELQCRCVYSRNLACYCPYQELMSAAKFMRSCPYKAGQTAIPEDITQVFLCTLQSLNNKDTSYHDSSNFHNGC